MHPSLPTRPTFDIVPKDEVAPNGKPAKKMTSSQRETEALKGGPEAIAGMQGTNADSVKNRRAIRMANLSAAQKLKAELAGGGQGEGEGDGDEPVTIERADEEEKEQMAPEDARAVLEEQGEDEGLDEDVVAPAIGTDEEKGEASVPLNGEETMEADDGENDAMDGIDGTNGRGGTDEIDAAPPAKKRGKRGRKRHAEHDEDQTLDGSDVEAPPNPEADQPVPKKKLKLNADGTVEGYVDDVR